MPFFTTRRLPIFQGRCPVAYSVAFMSTQTDLNSGLNSGASKGRILTVLSIVIVVVAIDWVTKRYAEANLDPYVAIPYLNDFFRIQYAENTGAFLGMGGDWSKLTRFLVFTAATTVFLVFVAFSTLRQKNIDRSELIAVSLIIGGGVGNLIDRMLRPEGAVVDFMNMGIGDLRTGIFNVADVALTAGVVIWLLPTGSKRGDSTPETPEPTT